MEAIFENFKKISIDSKSVSFNKENYIMPITIKVSFYTGWSWILSESRKIKREKELEIYVLEVNDGIIYIKTKEPEFFSWSNGPTLPSRNYALFLDGTVGYIYNDTVQKWAHSGPTWKLKN